MPVIPPERAGASVPVIRDAIDQQRLVWLHLPIGEKVASS